MLSFIAIVLVITIINPGNFAARPSSMANLRRIAQFYIVYCSNNGHTRKVEVQPGETAHAVAQLLAKETGLDDGSVWLFKNDPKLAGKEIPTYVLDPRTGQVSDNFARLPLSYTIVANLPLDAPPTTTPLAWTVGLQSNGEWSPDSMYLGEGGHIVYLDGHVDWFTKLDLIPGGNGAALVKYGTHTPTVNIHDALPPGTVILRSDPAK